MYRSAPGLDGLAVNEDHLARLDVPHVGGLAQVERARLGRHAVPIAPCQRRRVSAIASAKDECVSNRVIKGGVRQQSSQQKMSVSEIVSAVVCCVSNQGDPYASNRVAMADNVGNRAAVC